MTTLSTTTDPASNDPESMAGWLAEARREMDINEAQWLLTLGEFIAVQGYEVDGQLSAPNWVAAKCRMGRSTAYEKVRVACELRRRPWLAATFTNGTISYSAVRLICRIGLCNEALDNAFVKIAIEGSIADVEHAVRHWQLLDEQERPPPPERIGLRMAHGYCGLGKAVIEAPNDVLDELSAAIAAFDEKPDRDAPLEQRSRAHRRLDALLAMCRTGLEHAHGGAATGGDAYTVHVVADLDRLLGGRGRASLADGTPIDDATLARIACDCAVVAHLTRDGIEPVAMGRKTREWTTAQRRAVTVRDGGHCRMFGCTSTRCDIHHMVGWEDRGPTDVANGYLGCRHHHVLMHRGDIVVEGAPNGELRFYRRNGMLIGATRPQGDVTRQFP